MDQAGIWLSSERKKLHSYDDKIEGGELPHHNGTSCTLLGSSSALGGCGARWKKGSWGSARNIAHGLAPWD